MSAPLSRDLRTKYSVGAYLSQMEVDCSVFHTSSCCLIVSMKGFQCVPCNCAGRSSSGKEGR